MASDFFLKFDDFHKFESFEDDAAHVAHDLRRLGHNSVDLGDGFLRLIRDGMPVANEGVSPAALEVKHQDFKVKFDDLSISADLFKIGADFVAAADAQKKVDMKDIVVIKTIDKSSPLLFSEASAGGGGAGTVATDLASYESHLGITGTDFLKIAAGIADKPTETISLTFGAISVDYKEQSADLHKISADFVALARSASDFKIRGLSDAFLKYSNDAAALAADYLTVSADFHKISQDFAPSERGAAAPSFNQVVLQNPGDFAALAADLKFMNADYKLLAADTLKLGDTLQIAAHELLPAVQKT